MDPLGGPRVARSPLVWVAPRKAPRAPGAPGRGCWVPRGCLATGCQSLRRRTGRARVDVAVRATTLYRVCTTDPRDARDDTWALVRAVWDRTFSVLGPPAGGTPRAGDAVVHIGVSDFL